MLKKQSNDITLDPQDILTGVCATCKTLVTLPRWKVQPPITSPRLTSEAYSTFEDLPRAECPNCSATVFLSQLVCGNCVNRIKVLAKKNKLSTETLISELIMVID